MLDFRQNLKTKASSILKRPLKFIIITLTIVGISFASSSYKEDFFEISKNLDIFATLYKEINTYYVDDTKPGDLMKKGIDAMLNSLDPYTNFIPESDIEDYRFMTTGQYGGIGSVIRQHEEYIMVAEPYDGSPSVKAGLMAGDVIIEVDGKSTKGKTVADMSKVLKGQPNTPVMLKIKRPGNDQVLEINVMREEIKVKDVPYYGLIDENTGYIKLNSFTETASTEVKNAFKDLKETKKIKYLVLDLRDNGGGLLREAVNIVNLFVPKGQTVVETRGKVKAWDQIHKTLNEPIDTEIPMVVLIDHGSASASEIVSGALQDLDRAVIIGQKSYGKGLVQQTFDLSYNAKVKVTVAKYYIPSGRCIQKLDYSHKDEDGKAVVIADSLITEFSTKNGRKVKDGAGITPDIFVEKPELGDITFSLYTKNLMFDYATQYRLRNTSIDSLRFSIKPSDFEEFKAFIKDKDYTYETQTEKLLAELEKTMKEDQVDPAVEKPYQNLKNELSASKKNDIEKYKTEIIQYLEEELVSRYYYQKGRIRKSLTNDLDIQKALEVLNSSTQYQGVFAKDFAPVIPTK
jgi:carboxyl-terminal processing protease